MDSGRFVAPVVLTGASEKMRLASEETFGPVAPLFRFRDEQQAIEIANSTPYGLASYFYTNDLSRAFRVSGAARDRNGRAQHRGHIPWKSRRSVGSSSPGSATRAGVKASRNISRPRLSTSVASNSSLKVGPMTDGRRSYRIAVIPGDGIGKEVVPEGVRVLEPPPRATASSSSSDGSTSPRCDYYLQHGRMMPDDWKEQGRRGMTRSSSARSAGRTPCPTISRCGAR